MSNQFNLLSKKRFMPMFCTQFLGAFNDNVFKQALLLMLTYEGAKQLGMEISVLNNLVALVFILPFFLFSSTGGQIADKYEKSQLVRWIKLLEIVIVTIASFGFIFKIYPLLFLSLFLLGIQSTVFGPVKYAYLPQALHEDELVSGNGLFQTGTSLAILSAMMAAGFLVKIGDSYTYWLSLSVMLVAILGYISARAVPITKASKPDIKISFNIFKTSMQTIKFVIPYTALFFCLIAISWYWFYGATLITQIAEVTKVIFHGNQSVVILLTTIFSVGIAFGSLLCKTLTKGKISLKLMPVGLAGLSVFSCDLYFALSHIQVVHSDSTFLTVQQVLNVPGAIRVFADFTLLGVFGGLYIVPLYSFMQAYAPSSHRARVIAANNILNAFFMVGSAIFAIIVLSGLKQSLPMLFLLTGVLNIIVGGFVWYKIKKNTKNLIQNIGE